MNLIQLLEQPDLSAADIKVHPVSIQDTYQGESFGHKFVTVNGMVKAAADVNLLDNEVRIQNITVADDMARAGLATMLVDDLFKEFDPADHIHTTSDRTEDGSAFFQQYNPKGDRIFPRR